MAALQVSPADLLEQHLQAGTASVAVLGAGYVGLPLALAFVHRGHPVWAVDIDAARVSSLRAGTSYIQDIPDGKLQEAIRTGKLIPTADESIVGEADAIFICVPTPFTPQKQPDVSYIVRATEQIASRMRPGQLVVVRSTSYPGTTDELVRPILERTGYRVGEDVFLAFAPERMDPGNRRFQLEDVPIVVGGCDHHSTRLASLLLGRVAKSIVPVSTPGTAEMAKLLENVFRNVNIALVNQVAQLCDRMGLDVWEVVEAAATKPHGFMSFSPGLVGGHCIPVDPYYLAWKAREYDYHMDFIELAARVNDEMPYYVVNRLMTALRQRTHDSAKRVFVLGVAFKKDVNDARHSPALGVISLLQQQRVEVSYHDPYIPQVYVNGGALYSVPLKSELMKSADCVLILTDHSAIDYQTVVEEARLVFDSRNATRHVTRFREKIIRL